MDSNHVIPFSESTCSRLFGEGCVWPCARSETFAASSAMTKYTNEKTYMGLQYVSDLSLRGEFPTRCLWERWGDAQLGLNLILETCPTDLSKMGAMFPPSAKLRFRRESGARSIRRAARDVTVCRSDKGSNVSAEPESSHVSINFRCF